MSPCKQFRVFEICNNDEQIELSNTVAHNKVRISVDVVPVSRIEVECCSSTCTIDEMFDGDKFYFTLTFKNRGRYDIFIRDIFEQTSFSFVFYYDPLKHP